MSEVNIFRPVTENEKQDFIEVGQTGALDIFLSKLATKQQEYQRKYIPFDTYGARIDFDENIRKIVGDVSTSVGEAKAIKKVDLGKLDKYADSDRFELVEVKPVYEDKLLDGIRNTVITGKSFLYRSKIKGNKITVFVPNLDLAEVEARVDKDYGKGKSK